MYNSCFIHIHTFFNPLRRADVVIWHRAMAVLEPRTTVIEDLLDTLKFLAADPGDPVALGTGRKKILPVSPVLLSSSPPPSE